MSIQLGILIVYVLVMLGLSFWSTRIQKQSSTNRTLAYLLAGRNMPMIFIGAMVVGLAVGGASTVGVAQNAYTRGISAGWYNGAWGIGAIAVGLLAAAHFRKMTVKTVPEMMGLMYGPRTRFVGVINQLIVLITITSLQYVAGGAILQALLPDIFPTVQSGMFVSTVVFIVITVIGGYWASGLTNIINVIVIYIGVVIALIKTFTQYGGIAGIAANLPPGTDWFSLVGTGGPGLGVGMGLVTVIGWIAVMTTQAFSTQAVAQISFAARDEATARRGFILGGIVTLPAGFLCAFFGLAAAANAASLGLGAADGAKALPTLAMQLSPLIGGILLAALWAADISTAVSLLMGCSTLMVEDVVKKVYTKPIPPKNEMIVSRLTVLFVSILSFLLALTVSNILSTITTGLAIMTAFTLLNLASIYVPSVCKRAAGLPIMLASLLLWLFWTFLTPLEAICPPLQSIDIRGHIQQLVYLEWGACLLIFIGCALFAKEPAGVLIPQNDA